METMKRGWLLLPLAAMSLASALGDGAYLARAAVPPRHSVEVRSWATLARQHGARPVGLAPVLRQAPSHTVATTNLGAQATSGSSGWVQQAELTSTAQTRNDAFGWAVAVSGNTAVVAASDTPFQSNYGAVYIFTRTTSGVWSQQAELLDPQYGQGHDDQFGYAVALQGNVLVVSAPNATGPISYTGAAYVYVRAGTTWTLQAMLTASDAAHNDGFGYAVALSGSTILVGAPAKNNLEGAAYVFVYNGQSWSQQAEFAYPGRYLNADFGNRVAIWDNTALIAAPGAPVAFVYARSGTTWALQAVLSAPHSSFAFFGHDVALWGDTALVGVCCFNTHVNGAVEVYTRSGTTWSLRATLTAPGGALNGNFGTAVALSGNTAVVTGSGAFVYVGSGATWTFQAQLMPTDRPPTVIGAAAALQGNTALIGATGVPPAGYVFVRSGSDSPWTDTAGTARPALLTTRARSVHMR